MRDVFRFDTAKEPFEFFSASHNFPLVVIAGIILLLYIFRVQLAREPLSKYTRYGLAVFLLVFEAALYIWYFKYDQWSVDYSLPLHLCGMTFLLTIVMLLNKSYTLYEFTYFAGIGGAVQALLTPAAILSGYPHFTYYYFFVAHGGIVVASLYMTWVVGYRPHFRSIWKTLLYLNLYMGFIFFVNRLTDGNYLFITHKPAGGSLIDYLGPWPWYIVSMEAVALFVFLLLYLPFLVKDRRDRR